MSLPKAEHPTFTHELRVYESEGKWFVGFHNGYWAIPLTKTDAIARAMDKAMKEGVREIGVYNQAGELLETLAVQFG